jgi:transcriptional regulator with XRE-family HTH domain
MALKPHPEPIAKRIVAGEPPALPTGELPSGKPQAIELAGPDGRKHRMVLMPEADYRVLIEAARDNIEDLAGAAEAMAILRRVESGEEQTLPAEVVQRLGRENRIKVLREHRGLTQEALAAAVGSDRLYISQIERGVRKGGIDLLQKIAAAFDVPLDMLMSKPQDAGGADVSIGIIPDAEIAGRLRINRGRAKELRDRIADTRVLANAPLEQRPGGSGGEQKPRRRVKI